MLQHIQDCATTILTLDYPARRNALAMPMRVALLTALDAIESDRTVRDVVLTGAGGTFCAGGDSSGMNATDLAAGRVRFRVAYAVVRLLVQRSKPVVAAGVAFRSQTALAGRNGRSHRLLTERPQARAARRPRWHKWSTARGPLAARNN